MSDIKLGELIPVTKETKHQRDAIHVAIITVIAKEELQPGEKINIREDGAVEQCNYGIAIIDPYLKEPVKAGEMCWALMNPKSVANMRHLWDHPAIPSYYESDNAPDDYCIRDC